MKRLLAMMLALALSAGLAAGARALTVGFTQVGAESDWRTMNTIDLCDAVEAEGWELVYIDGQCKQENQIEALYEFVARGVDYILFTPVVAAGWEEVLTHVGEAGTPLILIDWSPDCADELGYAVHVVNYYVEHGRRMATWMVNYMNGANRGGGEIRVAILEGIIGASRTASHSEGISEVLSRPENANFKVVASQTGNFTRYEGQTAMESLLNSAGRIDVLLAHNDDMALGAIEAIKAAGLTPGKDIVIVGCGAGTYGLDAVRAGEMNATVECTPVYSPYVVEAIENMEAGQVYDRAVIHPEEGLFDQEGGVAYSADGRLSVRAADSTDRPGY